ncbi:MAG: DNA topoisomerase I [Candidatus Kariarchaeaceae archaeon]|jgi:DNA topoisomerase-1
MAATEMLPGYEINLPKYVTDKPYVMGLAEKPDAAKKIANRLDSKAKKVTIKVTRKGPGENTRLPDTTGYYVKAENENILIVPASGHLFTLVQDGIGWQYPVYDFKWVPYHEAAPKNRPPNKYELRIESAVEAIRHVAASAKDHIIMTDYDEEGEVIGGILLAQLVGEDVLNNAKRMKFSSFSKTELEESYKSAKSGSTINFGMYNRGLMRHYLDWLWGINLSRALMLSLKNTSGQYLTLSTGRVQGPTLSFVAERQHEMNSFVPVPYFRINLSIEGDEKYDLEHAVGKVESLSKAKSTVKKLKGQEAEVVEVKKRVSKIQPPTPLNLSKLQKEAYRHYKLSPSRTLRAAENLYLSASISYPRTSSEQYPPEMDHKEILTQLATQSGFKKIAAKLAKKSKKPKEGKKSDPAHPCIYPTGTSPEKNTGDEAKIYRLIVHRYFSTFGTAVEMEYNRLNFDISGEQFYLSGRRTLKSGWRELAGKYGETDDKELPDFTEGDRLPVSSVDWTESYSRSAPSYNENSLLTKMEEEEIGTKATRADIIKSLFDRKYIKGDAIEITPVGEVVNEVLQVYSSQVLSVQLSRQLEKMGDLVEETINEETADFSLADAIVQGVMLLHDMLEGLQENEDEVGALISRELQSQRRLATELGPCKTCGIGTLKIITSTMSGKRFVGCTEYFNNQSCNATYPLPQKGRLEPLDKSCKADDYPQISVKAAGKRPWTLCLNPECPIMKEFDEKRKKRQSKKKEDDAS